jgi:hypothetical protein
MTCIEHEKENIPFGIRPLMLAAGYPKALIFKIHMSLHLSSKF